MPVDTTPQTQGLQPSPYTPEALRVRCPHCRKLYLVQFNDIREAKPRFECIACNERFWLSMGEMNLANEIIGIPVTTREVPLPSKPPPAPTQGASTEPCPKCFKPIAAGARECNHCGILTAKARAALEFHENLPAHSNSLALAWKKVVEDYGNEDAHQEFLRAAQREYNLPFAAARFAQMLKLMPTDEVAKKRIAEIRAMGDVILPPRIERPKARFYPRLWQVPFVVAAFLIMVGVAIPFFRNLVGVGAAFMFIAIALHIQTGKR